MYQDAYRFSLEGCKRDVLKEEDWLEKGIAVIRMFQPHVYDGRGDWEEKAKCGLEDAVRARAANEPPAVYIPDIAAYTDVETSVYAQLHQNVLLPMKRL